MRKASHPSCTQDLDTHGPPLHPIPRMPNDQEAPPAYDEVVHEGLAQHTQDHTPQQSLSVPPIPPRPLSSATTSSQGSAAPSIPSASISAQASPRPQSASASSGPTPAGPLPTTRPQHGHPLLHDGKILVYPRGVPRCEKCGNTGYKGGDPSRKCSRCWRKYGRVYSGALKQAYEGTTSLSSVLEDSSLQRPLPMPITNTYQPYARPPPALYVMPTGHPAGPQGAPVQNTYSSYAPRPPVAPGVMPASQPQAGPSNAPERFPEDQHNSAPPLYAHASNTEKPLPEQQYPQQQVLQQAPQPYMNPTLPNNYVQAPPPIGPTISWYGSTPPAGAIPVLPGDPRIGGVLCPDCYGSGTLNTLFDAFFGGVECPRCGGTGRIMHGRFV